MFNLFENSKFCNVTLFVTIINQPNLTKPHSKIVVALFLKIPKFIISSEYYIFFVQQVHKQLVSLQKEVAATQPSIDQLVEDSHNCRRLVEKSRSHVHHGGPHIDLDRVDTDVNRVVQRWNNICSQLVDR